MNYVVKLEFDCGHGWSSVESEFYRLPSAGDLWSCPKCSSERNTGKNPGLTTIRKAWKRSK